MRGCLAGALQWPQIKAKTCSWKGNLLMSLMRAQGIPHRDGVMFTMHNGAQYIYCLITGEALVAGYGASTTDTFVQNRAAIERIASNKFDREEFEADYVIVIDQADIAPQ
jgi:hypothetical protein